MTALLRATTAIQSNAHLVQSISSRGREHSPRLNLTFSNLNGTSFPQIRVDVQLTSTYPAWTPSLFSLDIKRNHFAAAKSKIRRKSSIEARSFQSEKGGPSSTSFPIISKRIMGILGLIFKLPVILWGLLTKEKSIMTELEEDVVKAAEFVKEVAEGAEKIAEVVKDDAEKIEALMDKVEGTAKEVHKDIDEAFDNLESSVKINTKSESNVKDQVIITEDVEEEVKVNNAAGNAMTSPLQDTNQISTYSSSSLIADWALLNPWKGLRQSLQAGSFLDVSSGRSAMRAFLLVFSFAVLDILFSGRLRLHEQWHQLLISSLTLQM